LRARTHVRVVHTREGESEQECFLDASLTTTLFYSFLIVRVVGIHVLESADRSDLTLLTRIVLPVTCTLLQSAANPHESTKAKVYNMLSIHQSACRDMQIDLFPPLLQTTTN